MDTFQRAKAIGNIVRANYGLDDGEDLAFNLLESGVIRPGTSDNDAAGIVAQHLEQA